MMNFIAPNYKNNIKMKKENQSAILKMQGDCVIWLSWWTFVGNWMT